MATTGNYLSKVNFTDKCGSNASWDNPGSSGTSFYFCFPRGNFQVATGSASSILQSHPRITFSVWYYTGDPGSNGENNRVAVVEGRTIDRDTTITIFHNQSPDVSNYYETYGKYHLFRLDAIRDRGEGDQTHVYFHPEPIYGMADTRYNSDFKGFPIYGIADNTCIYINGRGWNSNVLTHFNLTDRRGAPISASVSSYITSGRWGNGV